MLKNVRKYNFVISHVLSSVGIRLRCDQVDELNINYVIKIKYFNRLTALIQTFGCDNSMYRCCTIWLIILEMPPHVDWSPSVLIIYTDWEKTRQQM